MERRPCRPSPRRLENSVDDFRDQGWKAFSRHLIDSCGLGTCGFEERTAFDLRPRKSNRGGFALLCGGVGMSLCNELSSLLGGAGPAAFRLSLRLGDERVGLALWLLKKIESHREFGLEFGSPIDAAAPKSA
jgi:hypothetical protein